MSAKAAKKKKAPAKSKKAAKAEGEAKAEEPVVKLPPAPRATVLSRHEGEMHERKAKGFSFGELAAAGLTFIVARSMGVPVDIRRRSSMEPNVGALKGWYVPAPKKTKQPKEGEVAEEVKAKPKRKAKPAKAAKKPVKKAKKE